MKIEHKSSYRFKSEYNVFKRCVDITEILLEKKQLMLLFGCIKKVKLNLYLSEEQFCKEYPDIKFQEYKNILFEEIAFIIQQNIVMPDLEEPSLVEVLQEDGADESDIGRLVEEKAEKRNYVQEKLLFDNVSLRYLFKEKTMENKLRNIKYEINKYVFSDDDEMRYAVVEFAVADKLGLEGIPAFFDNEKGIEKAKFVCDKQDLDYIIMKLQKIREKL
ncbi:MAG: hypothetical protein K2P64_00570 [Lachnospiraceae bacterium]|nr:hypothetical protein [Lachnospiraceae bacterium]